MRKNCFVMMPFAENLKEIYEEIYIPACDGFNVRCWRLDERQAPGSITEDIINSILEADFIIAELTSQNPNVFYELGFAHTVSKPVIMTTQSRADVPFDLSSYRVIRYEQTISGRAKLIEKLKIAIEEVLKAPYQTNNNPIHGAMRKRNLTIQDMTRPHLDNTKLKQIIRLHKRSVKYLAFIIIDDALLHLKANADIFDLKLLADTLYNKIEESAKLCSGFSAKGIKDVFPFLKEQFKKEEMEKVLQSTENLLFKKTTSLQKQQAARQYIRIISDEIFQRIFDEIDRLAKLSESE